MQKEALVDAVLADFDTLNMHASHMSRRLHCRSGDNGEDGDEDNGNDGEDGQDGEDCEDGPGGDGGDGGDGAPGGGAGGDGGDGGDAESTVPGDYLCDKFGIDCQ